MKKYYYIGEFEQLKEFGFYLENGNYFKDLDYNAFITIYDNKSIDVYLEDFCSIRMTRKEYEKILIQDLIKANLVEERDE